MTTATTIDPTPTTLTTPTPNPALTDELRALLQRIRRDPDAGAWAEWARRLMEGDARRKRKAADRAKAPAPTKRRR